MTKTDINRIIELCFNKHVSKDGEVIYWRDCCLKDYNFDEQGYLWVYADGMTVHSYRTPENI